MGTPSLCQPGPRSPGWAFTLGRSLRRLRWQTVAHRLPPVPSLHDPPTPGQHGPGWGSGIYCDSCRRDPGTPDPGPPSTPLCRCGATLPPVATPR